MSFGPDPWRQASWDGRAAANFICGGAGSGLVVFVALADVRGTALVLLLAAALALVALGLFCVWLEIGRPWRAFNVFAHWRRSWMSREALAALATFAAGSAAAAGATPFLWPAAAAALAFAYCQARILRAAKGIPAWREPRLAAFIVATALAEGAGLFWALSLHHRTVSLPLLAAFGGLVVARWLAWHAYRRRVRSAALPAARALDAAEPWLRYGGTLLPLALVAIAASGAIERAMLPAAAAGLCAVAAGAWVKWTLVTRAGFNQGFALARLPVRGTRP